MARTRRLLSLTAALALGLGSYAAAHHSFSATYDESRMVTVEGDLLQIIFRNPHSFVQLVVREPGKTATRYFVEWTASAQLGEQGVTSATLRAGDHVIVTGQPGRGVGERRLRMTMLRRPKDGFMWEWMPRDPMN